MPYKGWSRKSEDSWKRRKEDFFDKQLERALKMHKNPLVIGDKLGQILRDSEKEAVNLTTPRAIKKWASRSTIKKWNMILRDKRMVRELRIIGRSIANTLRPMAGHKFAQWVCSILNKSFEYYKLPFECITKGKVKTIISEKLTIRKKGKVVHDLKPDVDIVVLKKKGKNKIPIAIISAKTTLAERVMQTINWKRYFGQLPNDIRRIKIYLVTAWETFESGANRERVQELDGIFVCNENVKEYRKIKKFSKILKELKKI